MIIYFCVQKGIRTGDGKGRSPLLVEESSQKPEGFRGSA